MTARGDSSGAALSVADLRISIQDNELVHGVSFEVGAGESVGLIGASGSGKSLTCMAVAGLLGSGVRAGASGLHVTGSIRMAGVDHDLVGATEEQLARLRGAATGMVFQEPMTALNPVMRIGSQVAEVMRAHRTTSRAQAKQRAVDLLASTGLPDPARIARSYPHQLSGGQQQRVVLAIALANNPGLLICDEPTTALDVTVQAKVLDLISQRVAAVGASLLFISHDLAVVASICDRLLVMYQGEIVERGSVVDVLGDPQHHHTRQLMADADLGGNREVAHV